MVALTSPFKPTPTYVSKNWITIRPYCWNDKNKRKPAVLEYLGEAIKLSADSIVAKCEVPTNEKKETVKIGVEIQNTGKFPFLFGVETQEFESVSVPKVKPDFAINPGSSHQFDFSTSKSVGNRNTFLFYTRKAIQNLHNAGVKGTEKFLTDNPSNHMNQMFLHFVSLKLDNGYYKREKELAEKLEREKEELEREKEELKRKQEFLAMKEGHFLEHDCFEFCEFRNLRVDSANTPEFTGAIGHSKDQTSMQTEDIEHPFLTLYKEDKTYKAMVDSQMVSLGELAINLIFYTKGEKVKENSLTTEFNETLNAEKFSTTYKSAG